MFESKVNDILDKKGALLNAYAQQVDSATSTITSMIDDLGLVNDAIDDDIQDIKEYISKLKSMGDNLVATRKRNAAVIENCRALLGREIE